MAQTLTGLVLLLGERLYDRTRTRTIAQEAGLLQSSLNLDGAPRDWWSEVLRVARGGKRLDALLARLQDELPGHAGAITVPEEWAGAKPLSAPAPPGDAWSPYWDVGREDVEREALERLRHTRTPFVVCAPKGYGKTWFVRRLATRLRALPDVCSLVHIEELALSGTATADELMRGVATSIARAVGQGRESVDEVWDPRATPALNLEAFMEERVLRDPKGTFVFSVDIPDSLWDHRSRETFFAALRSWADKTEPRWEGVRLLLAYSTTPSLWLDDITKSPFNVPAQELADFDRGEVRTLAGRYELEWDDEEMAGVAAQIGGHPTLARRLMHACRVRGRRARDLLAVCHEEGGVFHEHLMGIVEDLQQRPSVGAALRAVHNTGRRPVTLKDYRALYTAGLIRQTEGRYHLRYGLLDHALAYL